MEKIIVGCYVLGMIQTNCYFLHREGSEKTVVIDVADSGRKFYEALRKQGLSVEAILLTHAHFDHILGLEEFQQCCPDVPLYASAKERELCESPALNCSEDYYQSAVCEPDVWLSDGQEFTLAGIPFQMISTPGHTKGSCSYYVAEQNLLFSGDTLFQYSVGRSDLPTGDGAQLEESVHRLLRLPPETEVCPGHGGMTSIARERKYNPFAE